MGCTAPADGGTLFSAYRLHMADPLYFTDGFTQTWRNGDPEGCVLAEQVDGPAVNASSFSLVYEW